MLIERVPVPEPCYKSRKGWFFVRFGGGICWFHLTVGRIDLMINYGKGK